MSDLISRAVERAAQRIANAGQVLPDTTIVTIINAELSAIAPIPARPDYEAVARRAAEKAIPDCLSRTCFIKGCHYDECWGCDDSKAERARVTAIILETLKGADH